MKGTCLVTGAAGFVGARLCGALAQRVRVRALLRQGVAGPWSESVVADLTTGVPGDATEGVDTIFHLAGRTHAVDESGGDEGSYRAVNVEGTRALLERAREAGVRRFVFTSSVKAIGEGGETVDDDTLPRPNSAYGRTKLEAERIVLEGGYVPEAVVLRPSLVYGAGVKGNLHNMIAAIDGGRFTRQIYEIVCGALVKPARTGIPSPVFRVLGWVGDVAGSLTRRRAPFDSAAYAKLFGSACYDGLALWRVLGIEPKWTLEAAMPDMIAAFRAR